MSEDSGWLSRIYSKLDEHNDKYKKDILAMGGSIVSIVISAVSLACSFQTANKANDLAENEQIMKIYDELSQQFSNDIKYFEFLKYEKEVLKSVPAEKEIANILEILEKKSDSRNEDFIEYILLMINKIYNSEFKADSNEILKTMKSLSKYEKDYLGNIRQYLISVSKKSCLLSPNLNDCNSDKSHSDPESKITTEKEYDQALESLKDSYNKLKQKYYSKLKTIR